MTQSSFAKDVDELLIKRAQKGDRKAFQSIYETFATPAYNLAYRLARNESVAEDALQEGMLLVYNRLDQFRFEAPFWSWVRIIFVNATLTILRSQNRREKVICLQDVFEESANNTDSLHWDIEHALTKLSEKRRTVVWLYAVEGHTHEEIATLLNTTISDSKVQLFRAREQLKQWWQNNHGETASTSIANEM